ncbi:MAG: DUF3783 domain-containing protein [Lachnospiraceae bacterium]|nr:DUF3783 domain-containing protein [Lachnospiraceae bacterium]MDD7178532.1 DUF3783 domain-containing protein [bacterium]MDY5516910.1 DUF3783 domain-containing protein [Lachnospiraceae bacterium]
MKKILFYQIRGEKRKQLKQICGALDIEILVVSPAEYGEPVGALTGFPGMRKQGKACVGAGVTGEMLVFVGMDDDALDEFLTVCKLEGVAPTSCKAILTPHNAGWSGEKLYAELVREHQAMGE